MQKIYLINKANGVDGTYCIARKKYCNNIYVEYWDIHKKQWLAFGTPMNLQAAYNTIVKENMLRYT